MSTRPAPEAPGSMTPQVTELLSRIQVVIKVPKVRHFMWKALFGKLNLSKGTQYGGIDATCAICGAIEETICHVLFGCRVARQTWALSQIPFPRVGFSTDSVFLNFQHLVGVMESDRFPNEMKLIIPWIIWHLWKCRTAFVFHNIRYDSQIVINKAKLDAKIPVELNKKDHWSPPPNGMMKCNVSGVWSSTEMSCGVAWILRDYLGKVHTHSRRAFAYASSDTEAELMGVLWAIESLRNIFPRGVIFESVSTEATEAVYHPERFPSFGHILDKILLNLADFDVWSMESVPYGANKVAFDIAYSVIRDGRSQSYIARHGPEWLDSLIEAEAREIAMFKLNPT